MFDGSETPSYFSLIHFLFYIERDFAKSLSSHAHSVEKSLKKEVRLTINSAVIGY